MTPDPSYEDRMNNPFRQSDGSPIYEHPEDVARERAVARRLSQIWGVRMRKFLRFMPGDWWAERPPFHHALAFVEIKCRPHPHNQFPTTWLPLRKWAPVAYTGLWLIPPVPGIVVFGFSDDIILCNLAWSIFPCKHHLSRNVAHRPERYQEPTLDIPIDHLFPPERLVKQA